MGPPSKEESVSILAIIQEALRIGRGYRSLWLFGFLVGLGSGGGSGGRGEQSAAQVAHPELVLTLLPIGIVIVLAFVVLKFVSTGALIDGVKRARSNGSLTLRDGFREGWAHWGVLLRIALLYLAASAASVLLLVGVAFLAGQLFGRPALIGAAAVCVVVASPWLVTLYMWQAFAERIAVFENRHALDAIRKARLFLHGRVQLGLRLLVAGFLGLLFVCLLGLVVIGPLAAVVIGLARVWDGTGAAMLGVVMLVPAVFVLIAMIGIMSSSVWTIGYLAEVEQ